MIKIFLVILSFILPVLSFAQNMHTCRGSLIDSSGQAVTDAMVVLMTKSDSVQLKLDYSRTGVFEITWTDSLKRELLLYVSAIGYNSKYVDVDKSHPDLGKIILIPLAVYMDEVTISVRKPIGHKFEQGRDEYTIPEWLSQRSYDVNSLLSLIPGLVMNGSTIEIAGVGTPAYLINGLNPRSGELESLNPKDIEKVTIIRMPGAMFGREVIGIISIQTKKTWHDYLSVQVKNDFKHTNVAANTSAVSINFHKGKLSHFLNYSYILQPEKYESWDSYETTIPDENIHYFMSVDMAMYERKNLHTIQYSPKWQLDNYSFIDLQYLFTTSNSSENNKTYTSWANENEPDLLSHLLGDGNAKTHYGVLRYDNTFDGKDRKRLTFNTVYTQIFDEKDNNLVEESLPAGRTDLFYRQKYRSDVLTSSLDYKITLGDALKIETGASYGNLWSRNRISYSDENRASRSWRRNEQFCFYLNMNHSIGRFHYQLGLRGQYERNYGKREKEKSKNYFYFLPSAGLTYRVNDNFNFMLYYRRITTYPTVSQLNTNILYFNKYMYNSGNSSLKPSVAHSFMTRLAFPQNLALTCKYAYDKNAIVTCTVIDKNDPKIVGIIPDNLDKTHSLELALTWNHTFGCYDVNLSGSYLRYFVDSRYVDQDVRLRPAYTFRANHSFTISPHIRASIYTVFQTSYYYYYVYTRKSYFISPQFQFSLLKNRLNIRVAGDNLLHAGNNYSRDTYHHTVSISEADYHPRGFSVGISYNFNNFRDLFRKNEAGDDLIKRAKTD